MQPPNDGNKPLFYSDLNWVKQRFKKMISLRLKQFKQEFEKEREEFKPQQNMTTFTENTEKFKGEQNIGNIRRYFLQGGSETDLTWEISNKNS